jgi:hypothetical protein
MCMPGLRSAAISVVSVNPTRIRPAMVICRPILAAIAPQAIRNQSGNRPTIAPSCARSTSGDWMRRPVQQTWASSNLGRFRSQSFRSCFANPENVDEFVPDYLPSGVAAVAAGGVSATVAGAGGTALNSTTAN